MIDRLNAHQKSRVSAGNFNLAQVALEWTVPASTQTAFRVVATWQVS